jgi:hypothetical protein
MYADTINAGLARGLSFQETFGAEADGDLDELRRTFLLKAFQRRQAALLAHLVETGRDAAGLVEMTLDELMGLEVSEAGAPLRTRYLERRPIVSASIGTSRAFVDTEGDPLQAETLSTYVRTLRRVDVNAEFNSALCRGLLHARFDTETPLSTKNGRRSDESRVSARDM